MLRIPKGMKNAVSIYIALTLISDKKSQSYHFEGTQNKNYLK